jgi:hypothetical protein
MLYAAIANARDTLSVSDAVMPKNVLSSMIDQRGKWLSCAKATIHLPSGQI